MGLLDYDLADVTSPRVEVLRDTAGPGSPAVRAMLGLLAAGDTPKARRDAAVVRLLHDAALRCGEVVSLDLEHFDAAGAVMVLGKGERQRRRIGLPEPTRAALLSWL